MTAAKTTTPDPDNPGAAIGGDPIPPPDEPKATKRTTAKKAGGAKRTSARRSTGRAPGRPKNPDIRRKTTELAEAIGAMVASVGMVKGDARIAYDGQVIASRGADIGDSVHALAESNPAIKRGLHKLYRSAGWGQLVTTVMGVALPIAACHGAVPVSFAAPFCPADLGPPPAPPERTKAPERAATAPQGPAERRPSRPAPSGGPQATNGAAAPDEAQGAIPGWPEGEPIPPSASVIPDDIGAVIP